MHLKAILLVMLAIVLSAGCIGPVNDIQEERADKYNTTRYCLDNQDMQYLDTVNVSFFTIDIFYQPSTDMIYYIAQATKAYDKGGIDTFYLSSMPEPQQSEFRNKYGLNNASI